MAPHAYAGKASKEERLMLSFQAFYRGVVSQELPNLVTFHGLLQRARTKLLLSFCQTEVQSQKGLAGHFPQIQSSHPQFRYLAKGYFFPTHVRAAV